MKIKYPLIILLLFSFLSFDIQAYMLLFHKGKDSQINSITYRYIIIYDKENSKVGLIPQIAFKGKPQDFCILVLTPTTPDISELDQDIFYDAEVLTNPVWRERGINCGSSGDFFGIDKEYEERPESIRNIMQESPMKISNITTYANTDSNNLIKWLDAEGFLYSENDKKAIDYYNALNWAFTIIEPDFLSYGGDDNIHKINPALFKFRYEADSLVYPMRLTVSGGVNLEMYILSNHKMTLENHEEYIEYANEFDKKELDRIEKLYPSFSILIGQQRYLTKIKPKLSIMMDEDKNIKNTKDNKDFRKVIYYGISPLMDFLPLGLVAIMFLAFRALAKRNNIRKESL